MTTPTNLTPKNVYCGKDKRLEEEEGNIIFKALILENFERYYRETKKTRKMLMTMEILDEFKIRSNGGEFYRYCKDDQDWVICDDAAARDKLSHALRYQIDYQINGKVRRPPMKRNLSSMSDSDSPVQKKRRSRSESFESCPGKIESVPTSDGCFDESVLADPLILFHEMVSSGELDQCYSTFIYSDVIAPKDADTRNLLCMGEFLSDTENDECEWSDSTDDLS